MELHKSISHNSVDRYLGNAFFANSSHIPGHRSPQNYSGRQNRILQTLYNPEFLQIKDLVFYKISQKLPFLVASFTNVGLKRTVAPLVDPRNQWDCWCRVGKERCFAFSSSLRSDHLPMASRLLHSPVQMRGVCLDLDFHFLEEAWLSLDRCLLR